jgi:hypothetical protein
MTSVDLHLDDSQRQGPTNTPWPSVIKGGPYMMTLLTALKETNVLLGEVAMDCEGLHHLFLSDRLRQQAKHNRAVIARTENAALTIRIKRKAA